MVAKQSCDKGETLGILSALQAENERIDAIDKLELDCAILYFKNALGDSDESLEEKIRVSLARFPVPVSYQLARLGILACSRVTKPLPEAALRP
jgi:hypothetical protein